MTARNTPSRILAAARALFDAEGASAVTMRRVAAAAEITPMAIYRHFANRELLLQRVTDDAFAEVAQQWNANARCADPLQGLLATLEQYLDYSLQHRHLFHYSFSVERDGARRYPEDFRARKSPTLNVIADMLSAGQQCGLFREGDPWAIAMSLWAHAHGLIVLYQAGRFSLDEAEFRAFYLESFGVLFNGVKR